MKLLLVMNFEAIRFDLTIDNSFAVHLCAQRACSCMLSGTDLVSDDELPVSLAAHDVPIDDDFTLAEFREPSDADEADDAGKEKLSRWQIRGRSLDVLEQVYAMDPFPGMLHPRTPDAHARCDAP